MNDLQMLAFFVLILMTMLGIYFRKWFAILSGLAWVMTAILIVSPISTVYFVLMIGPGMLFTVGGLSDIMDMV